ncbi:hypothetical protein RJ640_021594 [Escallonia rubra]|uniref:C3H1-type domain-containing protein n=1 Tax=Escallonia rubra TaxID=112253 RepID=A0AA88UJP1_9ASTE|nr:hypothetical protein RJ640_021594 [Escallonia rubra]
MPVGGQRSKVNKSAGPFDALLCLGQFFPDSPDRLDEFTDFIEGQSKIPVPTYFIGDYGIGAPKVLSAAAKDLANLGFKMDGLKICENLYWLRGSGKFKLNDGVLNRTPTSEVPPGISESSGTDSTISELVAEIKPRYHVAGTKGIFYAREPYANVDAVHVTRFLGLAPVGNTDKQKFIHAISPTPASTMSAAEIAVKPSNATSSPYTIIEKTAHNEGTGKRPSDISDSQYWRYDVTQKRKKLGEGDGEKLCFKYVSSGSCPRGEKCHFRHDVDAREQSMRGVCFDFMNKGKCERGPDCTFKHSLQEEGETRRPGSSRANATRSNECWFCLSSPNVESHLITSIGEHCYCALAKGPLVQDHVLILPVEHLPNTLSSPPECEAELVRFQDSLKVYFKNQEKEVVFFEWVSVRGTHANLQAIPIPSSRASVVQDIFNLAAEKLGFKFMALKRDSSSEARKSLRLDFDRKCSLFYVELPGGTILSLTVGENEKFPVQFGREVLAGLLNMADRADWRNCKLSKEEEIKMAERFKNRFEEYDPNR